MLACHRRPFVVNHAARVVEQLLLDCRSVVRAQGLCVAPQRAEMRRFGGGHLLGGGELLPDRDDREGEIHAVHEPDHGVHEARELVVRFEHRVLNAPANQAGENQRERHADGHGEKPHGH
jgi:hypothetical protein